MAWRVSPPRRTDRRPFTPSLEALEDRTVPSGVQGPITPGVFDPASGTWYLRNQNSPGAPDAGKFAYGAPGWLPVTGDWNGTGTAGIGVVDPATNTWYLRGTPSPGAPDVGKFAYGAPGWIPIVGDWTGTGKTGIGVIDPTTNTWYLRNEASPGAPDAGVFRFGAPGWLPVSGDWNGSGHTGIGAMDPATNTWFLRNAATSGAPDAGQFKYGAPGWLPIAGDWLGSGQDGIGAVDPATNTFYLRSLASPGTPDVGQFAYGAPGWLPVASDFKAAPTNLIGLSNLTTTLTNGVLTASGPVGNSVLNVPLALTAQSNGADPPILNLHLDPIHLNLLGLHVDTSPICLDITAQPGSGNLLGNLLTDIANLLNGGLPLSQTLSSLNPTQVNTLTTGLSSLLNSVLSDITSLTGATPSVTTSGGTSILKLSLGPVHLNLLGLHVNLDNCSGGPVMVSITAVPGPGNLLGNLISGLAHLLDGNAGATALLNRLTLIARDIENLL
jgi:hypothetical protein